MQRDVKQANCATQFSAVTVAIQCCDTEHVIFDIPTVSDFKKKKQTQV